MSGIVKTVFNKTDKMMCERIGRQIHRRLCGRKGEKILWLTVNHIWKIFRIILRKPYINLMDVVFLTMLNDEIVKKRKKNVIE